MTRVRRRRKNFVERHGLWTDEQTRAANAVVQAIKQAQARTRAFFLRRSARRAARQDRHGGGRGGADARRRDHDDDASCQGHRAQDRVAGVHARRRLRHGGDAGRRRFRHGGRPGDVPRAAVGGEHRLAALRHLFHQRQAGAVLDPAGSARRAGAAAATKASTSLPGSKSSFICSSWRTRGLRPPMPPGRRTRPR